MTAGVIENFVLPCFLQTVVMHATFLTGLAVCAVRKSVCGMINEKHHVVMDPALPARYLKNPCMVT